MKRAMTVISAAALLGGLGVACGGLDDDGVDPVTGSDTQVTQALRWRRHRTVTTTPAPAPTSPTPTTTPPTTTTSTNVNTAIAAAQTPDGRAIPQPAGPNGACPDVLVALGFWSCPTIDETCSYSAAGVRHDCRCARSDGEGQSAAWVCDQ